MPLEKQLEIFYVYAHEENITLKRQLVTHLRPPHEADNATHWDDGAIMAGQEWDVEIKEHLSSADIILLLISPDFLASKDCHEQMEAALERHHKGETRVIPIILRPVDWENAPFSKLQVLPKGGRPITSWPNQDEACVDVKKGINLAIDEIRRKREEQQRKIEAEVQSLRERANRCFSQGQYEEVLQCYNKALPLLEDTKEKVAILWGKADILLKLERAREVFQVYEELIRLEPDNGEPFEKKGDMLFDQKRFSEALNAYDLAIRRVPDNPLLRKKKGDILLNLGHWGLAIEAYDKAIELMHLISDPLIVAQVYANKGEAHWEINELKEAFAAFTTAVERDSNNAEWWRYRGEICSLLWDTEKTKEFYAKEAEESYNRAISLKAHNAYFHKEYGDALFKFNKFSRARQEYSEAVSLRPKFAYAYRNRSRVLRILAQEKYKEYRQLIEQAQEDDDQFRQLEDGPSQ